MSVKNVRERLKTVDDLHKGLRKELDILVNAESLIPYREKFDTLSANVTKSFENLSEIKDLIRNMSPAEKQEWKTKFKVRKTEYEEIIQEIGDLKNKYEQENLYVNGMNEQDEETNEEMIAEGRELMDSNKTSLQQTLHTINEAKVLGNESVDMLHQQHDQLDRIHGQLDNIESSLEVSRRIARNLARRMLTDKYIWGMILFVALAIVGLLVVNWVA